jgi:hypothetical protein
MTSIAPEDIQSTEELTGSSVVEQQIKSEAS